MQTIVYQCDTAMSAQKSPNCCNIEVLTNVLKTYSGTLIVISHDKSFTDQLFLSREIIL